MPNGKSGRTVSGLIQSNKAEIASDWIEGIATQAGARTAELMDAQELESETTALLDAISEAFLAENYDDISRPEFSTSISLLKDLNASRARLGFSPS